jgi:uncharacterized damage-inducible protein DinB
MGTIILVEGLSDQAALEVIATGTADGRAGRRSGRLTVMTAEDPKATLQRYLQEGRDAMLFKLAGLSEYDVRRPMTPTGTNLLGLVKHLSQIELGYFGETFGRPSPDQLQLDFEHDPNADLMAEAGESREYIIGLYHQAWEHADATISALPLDAPGQVPWWGDHGDVTLHRILVHVATETNRHAGQADIVREMIDGVVGLRSPGNNLPPGDAAWWKAYYDRVDRAAREASGD